MSASWNGSSCPGFRHLSKPKSTARNRCATQNGGRFEQKLKGGETFVELGDGLDAAVVVDEGEMLVGSVGVFIG